MTKLNRIAIDLAKNVFQVCGMSKNQTVIFNKKLKRTELIDFIAKHEQCEIAMEACYSSHYWARLFEEMGHTVKLIPAQHVTPFVRGNKSDHNDAIAIAEAAGRPNIKTVPIKSVEQQDIQSLHRIRERYVSNRTGLMNQIRGLVAEYGFIAPEGHAAFSKLLRELSAPENGGLSPLMKRQINPILEEYCLLTDRIDDIQDQLNALAQQNPLCKLLLSIPGIGVINATAIYSAIGTGCQFKNAREFAVWLGLTPKQSSSGEKFSSSGITKRGNRYLRKQLCHGARAALSRCRKKTDKLSIWGNQLVARRGMQKATVAMAARMARLCWVLLQRKERYQVVA
jgi:transposase